MNHFICKTTENWKCSSQLPRAQGDVFKYLLLSINSVHYVNLLIFGLQFLVSALIQQHDGETRSLILVWLKHKTRNNFVSKQTLKWHEFSFDFMLTEEQSFQHTEVTLRFKVSLSCSHLLCFSLIDDLMLQKWEKTNRNKGRKSRSNLNVLQSQ